jgi:hypothetical protein
MTERLYPLIPTPAVDAPEGHFEPEDDGGYDFPGPVAERLHSARHGGRKLWETSIERQERTHGEDLARRRDPAALYDAVGGITDAFERIGASLNPGSVPDDRDARIAELERQLAAGTAQESGAGGENPPPAKPAPARKTAASRAAAPAA